MKRICAAGRARTRALPMKAKGLVAGLDGSASIRLKVSLSVPIL